MGKIGIFGGTFDPVHNEHIALARAAIAELRLDSLLVIPAYSAPHKIGRKETAAEYRYQMTKLAFRGVPRCTVSDLELQRESTSYSYQTVERIKRMFPTEELFLIVGGDMLKDFKTWRYPERILAAATPVAASRKGDDADFEEEARYFRERFGKDFLKLSYEGKNVSATKVRTYLEFGLSADALVPEEVIAFAKSHALYRGDANVQKLRGALKLARLTHTANVVIEALRRARSIGVAESKAYTACALHDCAKYLSAEKYPSFSPPNGVPSPVLHAFLGAYVAETEYGITDSEILDAIRYHTTGKPNMSALEKLVFVADLVEEGRDYPDAPYLRALYRDGDFEECFRTCLRYQYEYLLRQKKPVFRLTEEAIEYYKEN